MQPVRILLVEDTSDHQRIFSEVITESRPNVRVHIAATGEEFIELAKDAGINCFLIDFNLPDGSASQLLRRAMGAIGDRPVIIMSASNDQNTVIESFRTGGWDFVPKDKALEGDYLWQRIEAAINRHRQKCQQQQREQRTIRELLRQGETDALTGLYNRHYFMGLLSRGSALRSHKQSLGCIMLDLDYFKQLNDTYGHAAGDRVLKTVARAIRPAAGCHDIVLRWGGEEFVVFHPSESLGECVLWAEMLRRRIASLRIIYKDQHLTCTASLGVVHRSAQRLGLDIIDLADQALYLAKEQGRNCVRTWDQVCVERRLAECADIPADSPAERLDKFIQSCSRTLGMHQLKHLSEHSEHVSRIATGLATMMKMSDDEVEQVRIAALFHDVGKSIVPESLIGKPGALSPAESQIVHHHVEASKRIAHRLGLDSDTLKLVELHHERYDSAREEEVPMGARVLCAADAMAAMLSNRSYREACSPEYVMKEMIRHKGSQFDPTVVDVATSHVDQWRLAA